MVTKVCQISIFFLNEVFTFLCLSVSYTFLSGEYYYCLSISAIPWKEGILIGNFCQNSFYFFNSFTGSIQDSPIPSFEGEAGEMVNGENDDVWAIGRETVYYFSASNGNWTTVAIPSDDSIELYEWDDEYNWLVLYLFYEPQDVKSEFVWAKITAGDGTPSFQLLNPGELSRPGTVNSFAQVLNANGTYGEFLLLS